MSRLTPSEQETINIAMAPTRRKSYGFVYGYLLAYAKDAVQLLKAGRYEDAERILQEATERVKEFEP